MTTFYLTRGRLETPFTQEIITPATLYSLQTNVSALPLGG